MSRVRVTTDKIKDLVDWHCFTGMSGGTGYFTNAYTHGGEDAAYAHAREMLRILTDAHATRERPTARTPEGTAVVVLDGNVGVSFGRVGRFGEVLTENSDAPYVTVVFDGGEHMTVSTEGLRLVRTEEGN